MAKTVRVKFLKPVPGYAYKVGETYDMVPEALSNFGDAVELLDKPAGTKSPDGEVEYDGGEIIDRMNKTVTAYRDQVASLNKELVAAKARIAELEAVVAAYSEEVGDSHTSIEQEPAAEGPDGETHVVEPPAAGEEAESEAIGQPSGEAASEVATSGEAWTTTPTASLNIPSGVKGALHNAGFKTAGQIAEGLDNGQVLLVDGIGEKKAAELREFIEKLAAS